MYVCLCISQFEFKETMYAELYTEFYIYIYVYRVIYNSEQDMTEKVFGKEYYSDKAEITCKSLKQWTRLLSGISSFLLHMLDDLP